MTTVWIDFEQSHLYFPRIIVGLLLAMALLMMVRFLPAKIQRLRSGQRPVFFQNKSSWKMVGGAVFLLWLYIVGMGVIGAFFPNRGFGFLIASIFFMLASTFLFMGERTRKKVLIGVINALVTPVLAWLVFGQAFHITLP